MMPAESDRPAAAPGLPATAAARPPEPADRSADTVRRLVDLLVNQVGHWTAPRWATPARPGDDSRADVVHRLVQRLADLGADAEGRPRRAVPRLDSDLALPDQLRVVAADLLAADPAPAVLAEAAEAIAATRRAL